MKSQQQGSHSSVTMRFALTFPPCKDQALTALRSVGFSLELRYVRCKVWVEQFGNSRHLHCQDSFCVALLTKRSKSMTRWQTLNLASQHLGEMHNTRSTLHWLINKQHQFRYPMQPSRSDEPFAQESLGKEVESWKIMTFHHDFACPVCRMSVGLTSARGMPLQAKRLISVGAKCIRLDSFCQAVVSNLDRWLV